MDIRQLFEADTEIYQALRLRGLREHPDAFGSSYEEEAPRSLDVVAERLRPIGDNFVLGAWESETLVGTVGFWRENHVKTRHKGGIWGVYVVPEARGAGVGRALMEAALVRVRSLSGLERVNLEVAANNLAARALYLSMGFVPFGTEPHALKVDGRYVDEELMVLPLLDPK